MPRPWRLRVEDMLDAIAYIETAQAGLTGNISYKDRIAFERAFEILSEASRHLPADIKSLNDQIRWRDLADLGNIVRHAYDRISIERLRETARRDLPPLKVVLLGIQASEQKE